MSAAIPERDLPVDLTPDQAVDAAYSTELATVASDLTRGLPVLIECEKDLAPFVFVQLRNRLKQSGLKCLYLDGRPREPERPAGATTPPTPGLIATMLAQLREAVRGPV